MVLRRLLALVAISVAWGWRPQLGGRRHALALQALAALGAGGDGARALDPETWAEERRDYRPELLPEAVSPVLDLQNFLTDAERSRLERILLKLQDDTGFKLRVVTQSQSRGRLCLGARHT